jgi:hypothetical protein
MTSSVLEVVVTRSDIVSGNAGYLMELSQYSSRVTSDTSEKDAFDSGSTLLYGQKVR